MEKEKIKPEWDIPCDFGTNTGEFEHYIGRAPKNKKEMEDWVHCLRKGMDAQLEWDVICKCASENFHKDDLKEKR